MYSITHRLLERAKRMKNSLTSRYNKREDVKYYTDVDLETKMWEVIELPTRKVVSRTEFPEDAERICNSLNVKKPFGERPLPNFLTLQG